MTTFVGDVLPDFGFTVTDNSTGALANPSSFTVVLTAPDGTTPSVSMTNTSTGLFAPTTPYVAAQSGQYRAVGTAVGNGCDGTSVLVWDVEATAPGWILPVADAQAFLNATRDSERPQVEDCLAVASDAVENYVGRKYRRQSVTETFDGGHVSVSLRKTPVISVTTVTEFGTAVASDGWVLDSNAGVLYRGSTVCPLPWQKGIQNVTVTYVAGATAIPQPIVYATKQVLAGIWADRNGGGRKTQADDYAQPADLVPRMVRHLLDPYRAPGF